jgi:hypothetical protein
VPEARAAVVPLSLENVARSILDVYESVSAPALKTNFDVEGILRDAR